MQHWTLFRTGSMIFALDRDYISCIRPIPDTPGRRDERIRHQIVKDRGRKLILIDLAAESAQDRLSHVTQDAEMIVVNQFPPLALLADKVNGHMKTNGDKIFELPAAFTGAAREFFPKVLQLTDYVALVINVEALPQLGIETGPAEVAYEPLEKPADNRQDWLGNSDEMDKTASLTSFERRSIEACIAEKLQLMIAQRVQKTVSNTITRKLNQHFE